MKIKRKGSAVWQGGIKDGKGAISTESGALKDYPYGFASRFEGQRGSNPEELIAAAHASCFTMALSLILGEAKLTAQQMNTSAEVTLEQMDGSYAITSLHLTLTAKIPGVDQATFEKLAAKAKAGCPVSTSEWRASAAGIFSTTFRGANSMSQKSPRAPRNASRSSVPRSSTFRTTVPRDSRPVSFQRLGSFPMKRLRPLR